MTRRNVHEFILWAYGMVYFGRANPFKKLALVFLIAHSIPSFGQYAPTSFGNTISNANIEVSFAIGELVVANTAGTEAQIHSGVIQPFTDIDVAINEVLTYNLIIAPNPTTSFLEIRQSETNFSQYEIYSISGVLVREGNFTEKIENLVNLPSGMYILRLVNETQIYNSLFEKI